MLVCNEEIDLNTIKYPMLISTKMDGIRCIFKDGQMLSRSLKPIANKQLQQKFERLKKLSKEQNVILDGELFGKGMSFQRITNFVMRKDLEDTKTIKKFGKEVIPDELKFYCFDCIMNDNPKELFFSRLDTLSTLAEWGKSTFKDVIIVKQIIANTTKEVHEYFEKVLQENYEGLIIKNPQSEYKFGRTTLNENSAYKLKPFLSFDLKVVDVEERFLNLNESQINELGKSFKRNTVDNKQATGIAASFVVLYNGMEQRVSLTGTEDFRREVWVNRKKYLGKIIEVKAMLVGSKDLLRHPTFLRFRGDKYE